jgi:hypothetical protein
MNRNLLDASNENLLSLPNIKILTTELDSTLISIETYSPELVMNTPQDQSSKDYWL